MHENVAKIVVGYIRGQWSRKRQLSFFDNSFRPIDYVNII